MAHTTQTRKATDHHGDTGKTITGSLTHEIGERRKAARSEPGVALPAVRLAVDGLAGFVALFGQRMCDLDADRVKRATVALGLDVQSISSALTTLVEELQQSVEDFDTAMNL